MRHLQIRRAAAGRAAAEGCTCAQCGSDLLTSPSPLPLEEVYDALGVTLGREDVRARKADYNDDLPRVIEDLRSERNAARVRSGACVF